MLYGPNTNQGANSIIYILEAGARLVASAVSRLARRGGFVDVRPEAELRFNEQINAELERSVWTRCDSYYRSPVGPHRHAVAPLGTRLRQGDVAASVPRLDSWRRHESVRFTPASPGKLASCVPHD